MLSQKWKLNAGDQLKCSALTSWPNCTCQSWGRYIFCRTQVVRNTWDTIPVRKNLTLFLKSMHCQKSNFCYLAFAKEKGKNHGVFVIGWCLCSHGMASSFTKLWWELCDNICVQSKAARIFGFHPVPLRHK